MKRVAVIGAGWAGAAAALTLVRSGVRVTVFEAGKTAGGRARRVDKDGRQFDNGQHLLLGAYSRSLAMIYSLHDDADRTILREPLGLNSAPGTVNSLRLRAPQVVAPLHLLFAIASASGISSGDKLASIVWAAKHLRPRSLATDETVSELLATQPESARSLLWEPLCVAALNTPPDRASARVFVEVLRRSFTGQRMASDLIIPRVDLSALLPEPALAEVMKAGGVVQLSSPVAAVRIEGSQVALVVRDEILHFDQVIVATGPQHVSRLLADCPEASDVAGKLGQLQYEPITTLHFEFAWVRDSAQTGMLMLDANPGQWLFWQRLPNGHWRASVVISAHHRQETETELLNATLAQLQRGYHLPEPVWHIAITEKRATYACTPSQNRLLAALPKRIGNLLFAGDWCHPDLPATLEAAVVSGEDAARSVINDFAQH
jgi:hydroxysqualene dehydroxylase